MGEREEGGGVFKSGVNLFIYSPAPNNRGEGGVSTKGALTDNLNINKRGVQTKGGGLKNVLGQKWQPVIANHGCPKLLIVEKHQYNFSFSLHLYIKQNRTFLIINLSNVDNKSYLRNQMRLCIHLLVLLVPSH